MVRVTVGTVCVCVKCWRGAWMAGSTVFPNCITDPRAVSQSERTRILNFNDSRGGNFFFTHTPNKMKELRKRDTIA